MIMEKIFSSEKSASVEKPKSIYTYRDNSDPERPVVFETVAGGILEADERYEKAKGADPKMQPQIGCSIESLRARQEKEFQSFLTDVVEKEGMSWQQFAEQEEKNTFEDYCEKLGLDQRILKDKKMLDIGADKCLFASYCTKHSISENVYSLEGSDESYMDEEIKKAIWPDGVRQSIESKTKRSLAQSLLFEDESFELVLNNSAMPGRDKEQFGKLTMEEDLDKSYDEIVRVLKPGGQARLAPFDANEDDEYFGRWAKATREKLAQLSARRDLDVRLEKMEDDYCRIVITKLEHTH